MATVGVIGCFNDLISLTIVVFSKQQSGYQMLLSHPFGRSSVQQLLTFLVNILIRQLCKDIQSSETNVLEKENVPESFYLLNNLKTTPVAIFLLLGR